MLETYRRYLSGEPLDLDKLYFQIQCSPLADQYPRSEFLRTRIKEISYVLNSWYEEQKRVANINSISTAKLAQIVLSTAHAFGGSKEPVTSKIGDFLPFEYDKEGAEVENQTKEILSKLIKRGSIPTHVIAALHPLINVG